MGVVEDIGPGAEGFQPGDAVWCNSLGHGGRQGAAAEFAVVTTDRLYPLPPGLDPVQTVALFHPAATAHLALFTHSGGRAAETVHVAGGAGHVGSMAIAMAVAAGLRVVTTCSAPDRERCRALGAEVAINYRSERLADELHAAAPDGYDL